MALEIKCGGCGARYRVKDELAGQFVQCRKCQTPIAVSAGASSAVVSTAAPAAAGSTTARQNMQSAGPVRTASNRVQTPVMRSVPAPPSPPAAPLQRAPLASPLASPPPAPPPAPARSSPPEDDEDLVKFRDDDDEGPVSRKPYTADDDDIDLAPALEARPQPPARRANSASLPGRSVTAVALDARASRAGQSTANHNDPTADASVDDDSSFDDEFALADIKEPAPVEDEGFQFSLPTLPPIITHTLLPWGLTVGCLGWAGYSAAMRLLELPGHAVGFSLLGGALLLYAAVLIPMTLKGVHSAAVTGKLRLPNAVWFQTFALFAMPTGLMVVGYLSGGTNTMITLGILGLVGAGVLMAFVYHADISQTLLTAFYGASWYAFGSALCAGILIGIGLLLSHAGFVVPWAAPAAQVATDDKPAAAPVAVAAPVEAPKPIAKPAEVVVEKVAPPPVVVAGPEWPVPAEKITADESWPTVQREFSNSIEVLTPMATAHSAGGAPFVALLQPKSTIIYDLRTGTKSGFIKAAFQSRDLLLSPDGTMLAGVESADSQSGALFPTEGGTNAIEIWSTKENRLLGRVPGDPTAAAPVPLAFAGGKLLGYGSSNGMNGLQEWDPANGAMIKQWSTPMLTRSSIAISHSGKFVAVTANPVVRVFDTQSGEIAGEMSSPIALRETKAMAFSPDGNTFAALVPGEASQAMTGPTDTLLEWKVTDGGKLLRAVSINLAATIAPINPNLPSVAAMDASDISYFQWTPDGRAVRVGNGLFEATSGKPVYTQPLEMSGYLSGRLIAMGDKRAVFEFLPTGTGSRMVLKTIDLPNQTIDSAITLAAASVATTQPAVASATPVFSPVAVGAVPAAQLVSAVPGAASGGPSVAAPVPLPVLANATSAGNTAPAVTIVSPSTALPQTGATPPAHATVQLALQQQWDVTVKNIVKADPIIIQNQLAAANAAIVQTESQLQAALVQYANLSHYKDVPDGNGEIIRNYENSDDVRGTAHENVTRLQDQLRDAKANIIKLQRAATAAPTLRTITAALDNGILAQITTDSEATAALADAMHVGDHVQITGLGQINEGILLVKLRTAALIPH